MYEIYRSKLFRINNYLILNIYKYLEEIIGVGFAWFMSTKRKAEIIQ